MKIHDVKQGTDDWKALRAGRLTASNLKKIITLAKMKFSESDGMRTFCNQLLWERWSGMPIESYSGGAMERRGGFEAQARGVYRMLVGNQVTQVGFITTDDDAFGLSPDGLVIPGAVPADYVWNPDNDGGLELKCPESWTQIGWILAGGLPDDHFMQVHGSMYGTGAKWWVFMAYCIGMAPLIITVKRNPLVIAAIDDAVKRFTDKLELGWATLIRHNGGPPDVKDFLPPDFEGAQLASAPSDGLAFDPFAHTANMGDAELADFIAGGEIPTGPRQSAVMDAARKGNQ